MENAKELTVTADEIRALVQVAVWQGAAITEMQECLIKGAPDRLGVLPSLVLAHPCVVKDKAIVDGVLDRLMVLQGSTGAAQQAATRKNLCEQADRLVAELDQAAAERMLRQ